MDTATPDDYQPRLRWISHAWRLAAMLAISGLVWLSIEMRQTELGFLVDVGLALPCFVLVHFRRRWPVAVAVVTTILSVGSALASGPATVAVVSLATRRRWLATASVAVLNLAAAYLFLALQPVTPGEPWWVTAITNLMFVAAVVASGMYIGSRRELLWTLRMRAERAEAEQEIRVEQARGVERNRIAREMHDVLAHRISQISMHAGALAFRQDLGADEMRANAALIQDKAHEALTDLRSVLGVLRDDRSGDLISPPQPTYADLPDLVDEARRSGMHLDYVDNLTGEEGVPDAVGRTLYRIIQEGVTNARKHAPGAVLAVEMAGSPGDGIDLTMRNPIGFGRSETPGAGLGLIGLAERAALRGGRLEHRHEGRAFVVRSWLPWVR